MSEGYGVDMWLTNKMVSGRLVRGTLVVAQALYRRLITPRGTLAYDLTYGLDVSGYIGATDPDRVRRTLPGMIRNELLQDDRVSSVDVTVTSFTASNGLASLTVDIAATLSASGESFVLTVEASALTTSLVGVST